MNIFKVIIQETQVLAGTNPKRKELFFKSERDRDFFVKGFKESDPSQTNKMIETKDIEVFD